MEWIFLVLGIPIGLVTTWIAALIMIGWARLQHGKLAISGHWAEYAETSTGREFSIGTLEYQWFRRRWEFNGTNYHSNGTPLCHWQTTSSTLNLQTGKFFYIFDSTDVGRFQSSSTGFGCLNLIRRHKTIVPEDGYFMYHDAEAVSVSHSMVPIARIPDSRGDSAAEILAETFPAAWAALNTPKQRRLMSINELEESA